MSERKAYLQHGAWGGPYRTESVEHRETELPRSGQTVSGYGRRMPTSYMVKYAKRWRRVYCVCYSNSGTLYVCIDGVDTVVNIS